MRLRALEHYLAGRSFDWMHRNLRVSKSTLIKWSKAENWKAQKARQQEIQRCSSDLLLEMTIAATTTKDPQQAYAAVKAARLVGLSQSGKPVLTSVSIAEALIEVLNADPEIGPLIKKRGPILVHQILDRAETIDAAAL